MSEPGSQGTDGTNRSGGGEQPAGGATPYREQDGPAQKPIVRLRGIRKTFWRGKEPVEVLAGLDLDVPVGSFEALMGPSGSGKSTLLNLIAGLDKPTGGEIEVNGKDLARLGEADLARWRSQTIGFIFQSYNLMPVLTALQNVELPLLLRKLSGPERKKRAQTY